MEAKRILKECPVFQSLSDAELDKILNLSDSLELEAGSTIFAEGSKADKLYVVDSGKIAIQTQLRLSQPQYSKRITVDVVTRSEMFGWSAVVEPYKYTMTAICLEPSRVMAIDGLKLRTLLRDDPRIGYEVLSRLIKVVASRLDETRQVLISERLVSV